MGVIAEQWAKQAIYDLETARAMARAGRWLYVLFCCQQAVEKMLKSRIVKISGEPPPRLHNLVRLAERAGISLSPDRADILRLLTAYYIESRYPEDIAPLSADADRGLAEEALQHTEETLQWLRSIES